MATLFEMLKAKGFEPALLYPTPTPSHSKAPKGRKASK